MTSSVVVGSDHPDGRGTRQGKAVQMGRPRIPFRQTRFAVPLFLGWFDDSNPHGEHERPGRHDVLRYPFSSNQPIKGMQVDILYHRATDLRATRFADHRTHPAERPLPRTRISRRESRRDVALKNNADRVARGHSIEPPCRHARQRRYGRPRRARQHRQTVFVPLEYDGAYPAYTHLTVTFSPPRPKATPMQRCRRLHTENR